MSEKVQLKGGISELEFGYTTLGETMHFMKGDQKMMIVNCKFCNGSGKIGDIVSGYKPCPTCGGAGEFSVNIPKDHAITCKFCNGSGKIGDIVSGYKPCHVCKGIGIIERPSINLSTTSNKVAVPTAVPRPLNFKYDIALSFASEDRQVVQQYAQSISQNNVSVFYDKYEQANLWGKDLYEKLDEVYRKQAKYCVIFISKFYAKKLWTNHERKSAQARAFEENREYILPVKLDDTELLGIRETVGYIDLRKTTINELVELTLKKLGTI